jgi:deoxyribodipyrimidine photo-lyase
MKKHLLWFRSDLRIHDNPALYQASQGAESLLAVYIQCPVQDRLHKRGARQLTFIQQHLQLLKKLFKQNQIEFHILECNLFSAVANLLNHFIQQHNITALFANRENGINEERRDQQVKDQINIPFQRFNGDCILPPATVLTQSNEMFRVFTAFRNAWIRQLQQQGYTLAPLPEIFTQPLITPAQSDSSSWPAGESAAQDRLHSFCQQSLLDYQEQRDFPNLDSTSRISPYLAIGTLSAKQCLHAIQSTLGYLPLSPGEKGFAWLNELVWREFYRHLMSAYPELSKNSCFKAPMNQLQWVNDKQLFKAWCEGKTGYPIVDAAMRCLNQSGWMHNRLRMIVASFLSKDLQMDWRLGEQYFMQQLIDADFASNNGGWQWAAGTGADAAPYFRIFNPSLQGEKFDKQGKFIKLWVEELKQVPEKYIHKPHIWFKSQNIQSSYPQPVVDHNLARKQTLLRYQTIMV